jgi:hypothetical protein
MITSDVHMMIFLFIGILSLVYIIGNATSLFSRYPRQKAIFLFAADVIVTSAMFFIIVYSSNSTNAAWLTVLMLFYVGIIYYKSNKFISSFEA